MAHQHSIRNKQSEQVADVNEEHVSSDDVDIFDQLQQEFDTLVSGKATEAFPPAFSDNSDKSFGELPTSDEQTGVPARAQEQQATEQPVDSTPIEPESADGDLMEDAADATPPLIEQPAIAASADKPTPAGADEVPDNRPLPAKKASSTPASTIMMLGLAVAILMAAVAGSIWTFYYPSSHQSASNKQTAKDTPQVIITKPDRAVKYIPVNKPNSSASDSNARKQDTAHITDHAAPATHRQPPGQARAHHKKTAPTASVPALSGDWVINLESFKELDDANAYVARLTKRDIHTDVMAIQIKGKAWYRVRLTGLPSRQEAEKQRLVLVKKLKLNSAWISKPRH